ARYGEHQPNSYLLPLSVDGLIVVASVSLVELSGRVRAALERDTTAVEQPAATPTGTRLAEPIIARPASDAALTMDTDVQCNAARGHADRSRSWPCAVPARGAGRPRRPAPARR